MKHRFTIAVMLAIALLRVSLIAAEKPDPLLTVQRIFGALTNSSLSISQARWGANGTRASYTVLEPSKGPAGGQDMVSYDAKSGERHDCGRGRASDPGRRVVAGGNRGLYAVARSVAPAGFHQLEARLATEHAG